jgi:hypothetical protein
LRVSANSVAQPKNASRNQERAVVSSIPAIGAV